MYQGKSGLLLSGIISLLTAFLILLTFFQGTSMDDFVGRYYFDTLGYANGVKSYLTYGNSRYFSLPVFIGASASYFLIDHYYIILVSGIALTILCLYYFLRSVIPILFIDLVSSRSILITSVLIFLFFCALVRELPSFIYWLATTITYLLPFGLFLVLVAIVCRLKWKVELQHQFNLN